MTKETISHLNVLQKQIHENAIAKGFHSQCTSDTMLLALILGELAEALEAFRNGKRFSLEIKGKEHPKERSTILFSGNTNDFFSYMEKVSKNSIHFHNNFKQVIKGTLEEEFADVVIRCLDFMALKNYSFQHKKMPTFESSDTFERCFFFVARRLDECDIYITHHKDLIIELFSKIDTIVSFMFEWASQLGFDLLPFIELKMKYNSTRPALHGKLF